MAPEPIYNRDLVADLLKLANTVIAEAHYDSKVCSWRIDRVVDAMISRRV